MNGVGSPSRPTNGLSLCAGAGGLDMGLMLAEPGFHTRCYVEWEEYPRRALIAAQRAGYFAPAPIWDDVTTFDGRPLRGAIDTILAGYPCQPFSAAGQRKGDKDERHLWPDVARIIREIEPRWVFLENVAGHVSLGLETVLRDLWDMGWTPAAGIFSAGETGAPHERQRVFIVAHREGAHWRGEQPAGSARGRWTGFAGDGAAMAHSDGGHPGAEWKQRGGEQRFQPEGRGTGGGDVENPGRSERRSGDARGHDADGQTPGRDQGTSRLGKSGEAVAHAKRDARHQGRCGFGGDRAPGSHGQADRLSTPLPAIFPPGPGDSAAWADALATAPYLAPAAGLADCLTWARDLASSLEGQSQAQAQPALCRMADGLALRSRSLRLLGNGVHPLAAGYAWRTLGAAHGLRPLGLDACDQDIAGASNGVDLT